MPKSKKQSGFTLIELLFVLGLLIIVILLVFVLLNPEKRLAEARNATRFGEVNEIAKAVETYQVEHQGNYPPGIIEDLLMIGTSMTDCDILCGKERIETQSQCLDLGASLKVIYLPRMPVDPRKGTSEKTYYAIRKITSQNFEVISCSPELNLSITKTR